jgi:hypothetical protein
VTDRFAALTNAEAHAQGISRAALRAVFQPVLHGIHVHRSVPLDFVARCAAATLVLPEGAAFSGLTAVQLLGLPLPRGAAWQQLPIELTVPPGPNRPRRRGLQIRRSLLLPSEIADASGLPVTTAARTFIDLAGRSSEIYLIVIGDAMLRMGLETPDTLAAAVEEAAGRRGIIVARHALPRLDGRSKSPPESELRARIEDAGMPRPVPNADVYDELGCWIATTDLLCVKAKVAIEYDGERHRDAEQFQRDLARDQLLSRAGYHVLRAGSRDLKPNATLFYDTLRTLLEERTPPEE